MCDRSLRRRRGAVLPGLFGPVEGVRGPVFMCFREQGVLTEEP